MGRPAKPKGRGSNRPYPEHYDNIFNSTEFGKGIPMAERAIIYNEVKPLNYNDSQAPKRDNSNPYADENGQPPTDPEALKNWYAWKEASTAAMAPETRSAFRAETLSKNKDFIKYTEKYFGGRRIEAAESLVGFHNRALRWGEQEYKEGRKPNYKNPYISGMSEKDGKLSILDEQKARAYTAYNKILGIGLIDQNRHGRRKLSEMKRQVGRKEAWDYTPEELDAIFQKIVQREYVTPEEGYAYMYRGIKDRVASWEKSRADAALEISIEKAEKAKKKNLAEDTKEPKQIPAPQPKQIPASTSTQNAVPQKAVNTGIRGLDLRAFPQTRPMVAESTNPRNPNSPVELEPPKLRYDNTEANEVNTAVPSRQQIRKKQPISIARPNKEPLSIKPEQYTYKVLEEREKFLESTRAKFEKLQRQPNKAELAQIDKRLKLFNGKIRTTLAVDKMDEHLKLSESYLEEQKHNAFVAKTQEYITKNKMAEKLSSNWSAVYDELETLKKNKKIDPKTYNKRVDELNSIRAGLLKNTDDLQKLRSGIANDLDADPIAKTVRQDMKQTEEQKVWLQMRMSDPRFNEFYLSYDRMVNTPTVWMDKETKNVQFVNPALAEANLNDAYMDGTMALLKQYLGPSLNRMDEPTLTKVAQRLEISYGVGHLDKSLKEKDKNEQKTKVEKLKNFILESINDNMFASATNQWARENHEGLAEWIFRVLGSERRNSQGLNIPELTQSIKNLRSRGEFQSLNDAYQQQLNVLKLMYNMQSQDGTTQSKDNGQTFSFDPKKAVGGYNTFLDFANSAADASLGFYSTEALGMLSGITGGVNDERDGGTKYSQGAKLRKYGNILDAYSRTDERLQLEPGEVYKKFVSPSGREPKTALPTSATTEDRSDSDIIALTAIAAQQSQIEKKDLPKDIITEPPLLNKALQMGGNLIGSMAGGSLKAAGGLSKMAIGGIKVGAKTARSYRVIKSAEKVASEVLKKAGTESVIAAINKYPVLAKWTKAAGKAIGLEAENIAHTVLTFEAMTILESRDRVTTKELTESLEKGLVFGGVAAVIGQGFRMAGAAAAKMLPSVRKLKGAIEKNKVSGDFFEGQDKIQQAIQGTIEKWQNVGYTVGNLAANPVQSQVSEALTNEKYDITSDEMVSQMITDLGFSLFLTKDAYRNYRKSNIGLLAGREKSNVFSETAENVDARTEIFEKRKVYYDDFQIGADPVAQAKKEQREYEEFKATSTRLIENQKVDSPEASDKLLDLVEKEIAFRKSNPEGEGENSVLKGFELDFLEKFHEKNKKTSEKEEAREEKKEQEKSTEAEVPTMEAVVAENNEDTFAPEQVDGTESEAVTGESPVKDAAAPEQTKTTEFISLAQWAERNDMSVRSARRSAQAGTINARKNERGHWIVEVEKEPDSFLHPELPLAHGEHSAASVVDLVKDAGDDKSLVETLAVSPHLNDVKVQVSPDGDVFYDHETKTIHLGLRQLNSDGTMAKLQIMEELIHAAITEQIYNGAIGDQVEILRQGLLANPDVQKAVALDQAALELQGGPQGGMSRLAYYMSDPVEFATALFTGKLSGIKDLIKEVSDNQKPGKFKEIVQKVLGRNEGTTYEQQLDDLKKSLVDVVREASEEKDVATESKDGEDVRATNEVENFDETAERQLASTQEQPAFTQTETKAIGGFSSETTTRTDARPQLRPVGSPTKNLRDVLNRRATWQSALRHAGEGRRQYVSKHVVEAGQKLSEMSIRLGIPEYAFLEAAKAKDPVAWKNYSVHKRVKLATELADNLLGNVLNNWKDASAVIKQATALEANVKEYEDAQQAEVRRWEQIAGWLGTNSRSQTVGLFIGKLNNLGFQAFKESVRESLLKEGKDIPANFDFMMSDTARLYGNVKWEETLVYSDGPIRVFPRKIPTKNRGNYITAMKQVVRTMAGPWNRPLQSKFLELLEGAELLSLEVEKGKRTVGTLKHAERSAFRDKARAEGYYVVPKGESGAVAFDLEHFIHGIQDFINEHASSKSRQDGLPWTQDEKLAKEIVDSLEEMIWWRILTSDSRWKFGQRPEFRAPEYKSLNLHKIIEDYRGEGLLDDPKIYFHRLSEISDARVTKNKDKINENIARIAEMLDKALTYDGQRGGFLFDEVSKALRIDSKIPEGVNIPDLTEKKTLHALQTILDQIHTFGVDPGAKSFVERIKMPAKYFGLVVGGDAYNSFKDLHHVDATLDWLGMEKLSETAYPRPEQQEDHARTLRKYGLVNLPDGRVGHKMFVITDELAKQFPELMGITGGLPLSEYFDGASFYINANTRRLHAGLSGKNPDNVYSIKPSGYLDNGGQVSIWKTALHSSLLDLMESSTDAPQFAAFLQTLAAQGYSVVTVESAIKSDGSYRYKLEPDADGNGYFYDEKGRIVGQRKAGQDVGITEADAQEYLGKTLEKINEGESPGLFTRYIPLTGNDGLKLLGGTDKLTRLTGAASGITGIPGMVPNDIGHSAYEKLFPAVRARNLEAARAYRTMRTLAGEDNRVKLDKDDIRLLDSIRELVLRDQSPIPDQYKNPIIQKTIADRIGLLYDADNNLDRNALEVFNEMYPGILARALDTPDALSSVPTLTEIIVGDRIKEASLTKMDGFGGVHLEPLVVPGLAFRKGMEYVHNTPDEYIAADPSTHDLDFMNQLVAGKEVVLPDGTVLPPLFIDGKVNRNAPYIFVSQDILDRINESRYRRGTMEKLGRLSLGSKAFGVLPVADSMEAMMPVVIAGILPGTNRIAAPDALMRDILGRDYDYDTLGFVINSEIFDTPDLSTPLGSVNNSYNDFWNEMYNLGLNLGKGKVNEPALKKGQKATPEEIPNVKRAQSIGTGSTFGYYRQPQKSLELGYGDRAMQSSGGADIGPAVSALRAITSGIRNMMALGIDSYHTVVKLGRSGPESEVQFRIKNDPNLGSQLSVWKQSFVDPYDPNTYDSELLLWGSFFGNVSVDGVAIDLSKGFPNNKTRDIFRRAVGYWRARYGGPASPEDLQDALGEKAFFETAAAVRYANMSSKREGNPTISPSPRADLTMQLAEQGARPRDPESKESSVQLQEPTRKESLFRALSEDYTKESNPLAEAIEKATGGIPKLAKDIDLFKELIFRKGGNTEGIQQVLGMVANGKASSALLEVLIQVGAIEPRGEFRIPNSSDPNGVQILAKGGSFYEYDPMTKEITPLKNYELLLQNMDKLTGSVQHLNVANKGPNFMNLVADGKTILVNFDNGNYTGNNTRANVYWVAKPGSSSSGRSIGNTLDLIKDAILSGKKVLINNTAGSDPAAQAAYKKLSQEVDSLEDSLKSGNKNRLGFNMLSGQQKYEAFGKALSIVAQDYYPNNKAKREYVAGHLLLKHFSDTYRISPGVTNPIATVLSGFDPNVTIPRHPTGRTVESYIFDKMLTRTDIPESMSTTEVNNTEVEPTVEDLQKIVGKENGSGKLHTWQSTLSSEGKTVGQKAASRFDINLGKSSAKSVRDVFDAMRAKSGMGIRDWDKTTATAMRGTVAEIFKDFVNKGISDEETEKLVDTLFSDPLFNDIDSRGLIGGTKASRDNLKVAAVLQAMSAAKEMARVNRKWTKSDSAIKRRIGNIWHSYVNPMARQGDTDLVRVSSNYGTFYGANHSVMSFFSIENGRIVASQKQKVATGTNVWTQGNNRIVFDAAPNVEFLAPHSEFHQMIDAAGAAVDIATSYLDTFLGGATDERTWKERRLFPHRRITHYNKSVNVEFLEAVHQLGQILSDPEAHKNLPLDFSGLQFHGTFDGITTSNTNITYTMKNGKIKSLGLNGTYKGADMAVLKEIAHDIVTTAQAKSNIAMDPLKKGQMAEAIRWLIAQKGVQHMIANMHDAIAASIDSFAQYHEANKGGAAEGIGIMNEQLGRMSTELREQAERLRSDDLNITMDFATTTDRLRKQQEISKRMIEIKSMSHAELQAEADFINKGLGWAGDFLPTVESLREFYEILLKATAPPRAETTTILSVVPSSVTDRDSQEEYNPALDAITDRVFRHIVSQKGESWVGSQAEMNARIQDRLAGMMTSVNAAMRTGYMAKYGNDETFLAKTATLSRFKYKDYQFQNSLDIGTLRRAVIAKGSALSYQDHGLHTGVMMAVTTRTDVEKMETRTQVQHVQFLGFTTSKDGRGKPMLVGFRAEGPNNPESQKMVFIDLDSIQDLRYGTKLGMIEAFADYRDRKRVEKYFGKVRQAVEEYQSTTESGGTHLDPIDALVADAYELQGAIGENISEEKVQELRELFLAGVKADPNSPMGKFASVFGKGFMSRFYYGGGRYLLGAAASLGTGIAFAPIVPMALPLGALYASIKLGQLVVSHGLHAIGNVIGGAARLFYLDTYGGWTTVKKAYSRDGETPQSVSGSVARRFVGTNRYGDVFMDPKSAKNRPTSQIERSAATLQKIARKEGIHTEVNVGKGADDEAIIAGMDAAREKMEAIIDNLKKYSEEFKVVTRFDPRTGKAHAEITSVSGEGLTEFEKMNLDQINMALTLVTKRGAPMFGLGHMTELTKYVNRLNSVAFRDVSKTEYGGATRAASGLDYAFRLQERDTGHIGGVEEGERFLSLMRINAIRTFGDDILGKYIEKNPYHSTHIGSALTLFSQWSRNYFTQTTKGINERRKFYKAIMSEIRKDKTAAKRLNDLAGALDETFGVNRRKQIAVGTRMASRQHGAIARLVGVGLLANFFKIVASSLVAGSTISQMIFDDDEEKNDENSFSFEAEEKPEESSFSARELAKKIQTMEYQSGNSLNMVSRLTDPNSVYSQGILSALLLAHDGIDLYEKNKKLRLSPLMYDDEISATKKKRSGHAVNYVEKGLKTGEESYKVFGPGFGMSTLESAGEAASLVIALHALDAPEEEWNKHMEKIILDGTAWTRNLPIVGPIHSIGNEVYSSVKTFLKELGYKGPEKKKEEEFKL